MSQDKVVITKDNGTWTIERVDDLAREAARNIPNWAGWTEAQVLAWHQTNIDDLISTATNLEDFRTVLENISTENRAIARMIVALRDKTWPGLAD